jgi:predicted kinase
MCARVGAVHAERRCSTALIGGVSKDWPMLVVMTGLPGTGKSAVAEAVARALPAPVFSVDPLEAVLVRAGIDREHRSDYAAYDVVAALAESQLQLGQSAVVDAVNALERLRRWFLGLAEPVGAPAVLIETICSDRRLHRERFENRDRAIEGWVYEPTWRDVERRMLEYEPSDVERLVLDAVAPFEENARAALEYVSVRS